MPTWRGQSNHDVNTSEYSREINQLLHYLDENLKDDQKLYVNFHPIVQKFVKLDNYEHIYPFPSGVDKYEFLNSVDALITDYSSVFFDYSITRKPIILYMYDYEEYMHDRGMYFDIKELPFRKIYDKEALRDCLVNETFREDSYENDMEYTEKYIQYDSIDAAKNMAELVFHGNMCDMPTIDYSFNKEKKRRVLHYPNVKTAQTIDTIAQIAKKDEDVVIFEKRFFNPELSSHLHDNYLDDFDYIFITRTLPRTYAEEVLKICKQTKLPMVLDVHHHNCNSCEEDIKSLLPKVFSTWEEEKLPPKIHFSSPREFENDRKHADFIDAKKFLEFIYKAKESVNKDFDVMLEAKKKDITLNTLVKDLKHITKDIKFIDNSTFEI